MLIIKFLTLNCHFMNFFTNLEVNLIDVILKVEDLK